MSHHFRQSSRATSVPLFMMSHLGRIAIPSTTGRRVTLEYTLIAGVNDSAEDALRLSAFARELPSKINLIPYNPVPGLPWKRPTQREVDQFAEILYPRAPAVTVRHTMGGEIWAACGQLGGLSAAS